MPVLCRCSPLFSGGAFCCRLSVACSLSVLSVAGSLSVLSVASSLSVLSVAGSLSMLSFAGSLSMLSVAGSLSVAICCRLSLSLSLGALCCRPSVAGSLLPALCCRLSVAGPLSMLSVACCLLVFSFAGSLSVLSVVLWRSLRRLSVLQRTRTSAVSQYGSRRWRSAKESNIRSIVLSPVLANPPVLLAGR